MVANAEYSLQYTLVAFRVFASVPYSIISPETKPPTSNEYIVQLESWKCSLRQERGEAGVSRERDSAAANTIYFSLAMLVFAIRPSKMLIPNGVAHKIFTCLKHR